MYDVCCVTVSKEKEAMNGKDSKGKDTWEGLEVGKRREKII